MPYRLELRPYQITGVELIRNAYREGFKSPLYVLPSGAGKTVAYSYIAKCAREKGNKILILEHRQELINQCSEKLMAFGVEHGIIASGKTMNNEGVQIASVQTLARRIDKLPSWFEPELIIVDECFVPSTKILTINGYKTIREIKINEIIYSWNEYSQQFDEKKVINIFKNNISKIYKIKFANKEIHCTGNHPILTKRGWVTAQNLKIGIDMMHGIIYLPLYEKVKKYVNQILSIVWKTNSWRQKILLHKPLENRYGKEKRIIGNAPCLFCMQEKYNSSRQRNKSLQEKKHKRKKSCLLFRRMRNRIQEKNIFGNNVENKQNIWKTISRKNESEQSDERSDSKSKSFDIITSNEMETTSTGWKWKANSITSTIIGLCSWLGNGVCSSNKKTWTKLSNLLQIRYCKFNFKNRNRSGWFFSRIIYKKNTRPKKDRISKWYRVENIEIYQQGSNKKFEQLCPKGIVFNLEIEDNHTYIAENIIVHNCHHNRAASWTCILEHFKASKKLHVTATPIRLDGKGLGVACKGFADTLIIGPSTQELINLGFLAKVSIYAPPVGINIEGIKKTMGDYNKKELSDCIDKSYITGNAIAHYKRICPTSKAIAYCVSLQHAENITLEFKRAGESAVMIDGRMNEKTRNNIVKDFATDKIKILVSVDLISEGFDAPQASCGIMLRPTASLGLWLQQCGRILRPYPNKTEAIILDHAGNSLKHGLPTETRDWTLEGEKTPEMKKQQLLKLRTCKQCYAVFKAYLNVCPQCQNEYELSPREIEEREGELQKIEEVKQKWTQKAEIYNAKDLATLTELGKQRGYRYPRIWAEHIIRARIRKKESKVF